MNNKRVDINEQYFNTLEEFFEYCSKETGETINSWSLHRKFKSRFDEYNNIDVIRVNDSYSITFDSGGYTLIKF